LFFSRSSIEIFPGQNISGLIFVHIIHFEVWSSVFVRTFNRQRLSFKRVPACCRRA